MSRFYLLNPTAAREYAPLRELRTTIQQILECELIFPSQWCLELILSLHTPFAPTYIRNTF